MTLFKKRFSGHEMDFSLIATILSIIGGGGLVGLFAWVWNMASKYQDLVTRVNQNEERDKEERAKTDAKFSELYTSRNKTNETLVELSTTIKMMISNMDTQFAQLNKKIDEIKKDK